MMIAQPLLPIDSSKYLQKEEGCRAGGGTEGREWGEEHETALSMSAIAGAGL